MTAAFISYSTRSIITKIPGVNREFNYVRSGAEGRVRTGMSFRSRDFKSLASANFTTSAKEEWRRHPDSNWRIEVLQTSALPLGYGAKKMERETGLGPATFALARRRSSQLSYSRTFGASGQSRTVDTGIFSPLLYQLSYRGKQWWEQ